MLLCIVLASTLLYVGSIYNAKSMQLIQCQQNIGRTNSMKRGFEKNSSGMGICKWSFEQWLKYGRWESKKQITKSTSFNQRDQELAQYLKKIRNSKCSGGNKYEMVCSAKGNNQSAVVCGNKNCKCRQNLKKNSLCTWIKLDDLVMEIHKKRESTQEISTVEQHLKEEMNKIHNESLGIMERAFDELKSELKDIRLNGFEKQLLGHIQNDTLLEVSGNEIDEVMDRLHIDREESKISTENKTIDKLTELRQTIMQTINRKINKLFGPYGKQTLSDIDSEIITEIDQLEILKGFFADRKLPKMSNLLYRASENDFKVSKFWEKCDGIPNTLVLVKTSFGKIIGGFTPLSWKKDKHGFQADESGQSFVFSISENAKFKLKEDKRHQAIHHRVDRGPQFGDDNLRLIDKSNIHIVSWTNIGKYYSNPAFEYGKSSTWKRFTGNADSKFFTTIEWEVHELVF